MLLSAVVMNGGGVTCLRQVDIQRLSTEGEVTSAVYLSSDVTPTGKR